MIKTAKDLLQLMNKRERQRILLSVLFSFFDFTLLGVPFLISSIMVEKIIGKTLQSSNVLLYTLIMIACLLLRIILRLYTLKFRSASGYIAMCDERKRLGKALRTLPMGYLKEKNLGDLISTFTSDAIMVELEGMGVIEKIAIGFSSLTLILTMLLILDFRLFFTVLLLLIPVYFLFKYLLGTVDRHQLHRQQEIGEATEEVVEFIKGLKIIKTYNMTDKQFYKTEKAFKRLKTFSIKSELSHIPPAALYQLGFKLIITVIITLTALLALSGQLSFPVTFLLMLTSLSLFEGVEMMGIWSIFSRFTAEAISRMNIIKNTALKEQVSGDKLTEKYDIEFKNVNFSYHSKPILKDISFYIAEKTTTALVGLSGSGKTTITNLIARFWDVNSGEVLMNGKNIKSLVIQNLLQNISFVFQSVFLFDDTILENIRLGRPSATREEVIEVAKKSHCHEFIMGLDKGYDTLIGEEGARLSGGERQRISIARALLKDAPIVLLDEVTANVDVENEVLIQSALSELLRDRTVIIIAHKLSTIKNVDQILVIDEGRITERGRHEELLKISPIYIKLWNLQQNASHWNI